jgi:FkbM family methyltransferase
MAGFRELRAHHFHPAVLNGDALVVDLGAHRGEFSSYIAAQYGCSIFGLEANPDLYKTLPEIPRARFMNAAVSREDSPVTFYVSETLEASSVYQTVADGRGQTVPVTVPGITLDSLLESENIRKVALLKVDIENAEFDMIERASDETLSKITQLTVEFHLVRHSQEFTPERILRIGKRLKRLGFQTFTMDHNFTDVLFLNPSKVPWRFSERVAMFIHSIIISPVRMHLLS